MAMLFVWLFLLSANVANACLIEMTPSEAMPHERHHRSPVSAPSGLTAAAADHEPTALVRDGHEDVRTHPVHCQSAQAFTHELAPWTSPGNAVDRDAVMVATARPSVPMAPAGQLGTLWQVGDPVAQVVPLFIRFRRLLP